MSCRYCCKDRKYYDYPEVDMNGRCVSCGWKVYSDLEMDQINATRWLVRISVAGAALFILAVLGKTYGM